MSYDYLFQKANLLYADGALLEAEQLYRQILLVAPKQPDVLNMLGLIAQLKGQNDVAVDFFYQVLEQVSNRWLVHFNLAVSLEALENYNQAERHYLQSLQLKPDLKEACNNLAGIYEKTKRANLAVQYYKKALEIDAGYLDAAVNLVVLQEDWDGLHTLSLKNPQSSMPKYYLALKNFHENNLPTAQQYILQALQVDNTSFEIYLLDAQIKLKSKDFSGAKQAFYKTLSINSHCLPALINLAVLEQNEDLFKQALDLAPDDFEAHTAYGDYLYAQNCTHEALEEYRKAVILNPDSPQVSNNLALILKDIGEYEQALDLFFNAFIKTPQTVEISQNIAQTLTMLQTKNPNRALQIAKRWVKTAPNNVWALHTLAFFNGKSAGDEQQFYELLFDAFAENYNTTMQNINYGIFHKIKELEINLTGSILDLGCGTGLSGQELKTPENEFTGIDISQNMLNLAAQTKAYKSLIKISIEEFLQSHKLDYNYIIAFDVFNYLQKPEDLFNKMALISMLFTIENAPLEVATNCLIPAGRYQHNPLYIKEKLANAGYDNIKAYPLVLRTESGTPVNGTLFFAR